MMSTTLDHLVIAAESLEQGIEYVRSALGVEISEGGVHKSMGTHNHLMQLGNNVYLEIIAIDPLGLVPDRLRWFGLDDPLMRASLQKQARLITWVVNTTNIDKTCQVSKFPLGIPTELKRDNLCWKIALTEDGRLLANGYLPYLIQWISSPHPSNSMTDLGCRLLSLEIYHNRADWLRSILKSIDAERLVSIHDLPDCESTYLAAKFETPSGVRILTSRDCGLLD